MKREDQLKKLYYEEAEKCLEHYLWLEKEMPEGFFKEVNKDILMLIAHNLMKFESQKYEVSIQMKDRAIMLFLDEPNIDLKILSEFSEDSLRSYQTFTSKNPLPFFKIKYPLHVAILYFLVDLEHLDNQVVPEKFIPVYEITAKKFPKITPDEVLRALKNMTPSFLNYLTLDNLVKAVTLFLRAETRDSCQYEVDYLEDHENFMRIILAWKNTPKNYFLYRLLRGIDRHNLIITSLNASHLFPFQKENIFLLQLELQGEGGKPAWETTPILDFIKDLITVKYFASFDLIDSKLIQKGIITANQGNLLRAMENFIHQVLVHLDSNIYTLEQIEEALCRHPELTVQLIKAFQFRFDPVLKDLEKYFFTKENFLIDLEKLDTGYEESDKRRKNILFQAMNFINYTLKTNYYRPNYSSLSFRLDPKYLDEVPFNRQNKFPELPFAIFFIKGMHFFGFHIRFKDLARGGLRTVYPEHTERMLVERNNVFTECYNLAYTQNLKNKDIPEGGAKGIIFLKPFEHLDSEALVYQQELLDEKADAKKVEKLIEIFKKEQSVEHLYEAQRSFIEGLLVLVNCDSEGVLRAKDIVDYWQKPEYLYLGPDENMHDAMISWIANYSKKCHYRPGFSFISGKPTLGINHKEYGVTSLGVNVYMESVLKKYLGIDPNTTPFSIKMSGGPDGDVAGNQIYNLYKYYRETAKLIALTDISGTIYDPMGLNLSLLVDLFKEGKSIRYYPKEALNEGAFLVDKFSKRKETSLVQHTLSVKKENKQLVEKWLSGSELNHLLRNNVHQTVADIFIPAGGRPRTLNESNYKEFLDPLGVPTSKVIIEGANLYLTPFARSALEDKGVLIIKDSSANKTGVICSSFEVLCGLILGDEIFLKNKEQIVLEIKERLIEYASLEASLLLRTHEETHENLTDISDKLSKRINQFKDQMLKYLENITLSDDPNDPLIRCFLSYCLPYLRKNFQKALLQEIPPIHKKAIISAAIASKIVYKKGLNWFPSLIDILPQLLSEE
jgi:glutamate dehydrogenase